MISNAVRPPPPATSRTASALLLALLVPLLACQTARRKLTEKVVEKAVENAGAEDVDIDSKSGKVTIKDKKGNVSTFGNNTKLPEGWPAELANYPGSTLHASFMSKAGGTISGSIKMQTAASASDVFSHYKSKLPGFEQVTETNINGMQTRTFRKDKRSVGVTYIADQKGASGKALVSLVVAKY